MEGGLSEAEREKHVLRVFPKRHAGKFAPPSPPLYRTERGQFYQKYQPQPLHITSFITGLSMAAGGGPRAFFSNLQDFRGSCLLS